MANFKAPCKWCEFVQVFNGQLGHLYKLGDLKTAENFGPIPWQAAEIIGGLLATE